jgi:triacylglycerol lipase
MIIIDKALAVDSDLRPALAIMPNLEGIAERLPAIREMLQGDPVRLGVDGQITVTRVTLPSKQGSPEVPALLYQPQRWPDGALAPALLNIHGGGFVAGSAQREDLAMRSVAAELGCVVLSPDYRLAPESPFPAAIEDCDSALSWLLQEAAELRIDAGRIAVRGVSAGGGLALGLALKVRDRGSSPICFLQLLYPMLDDRTAEHPWTGNFVWTAASNRFGWDSVLRNQVRGKPSPYAVPARAPDVSGLPATFLAVGSIDLFAGETLSLAARLIDVGVPVELHLYPGAYHGFNLVADSRVAKSFAGVASAALRRAMHD